MAEAVRAQGGPGGNPLGTMPIKSMIWKFAIPGIISQLVSSANNIIDQIFIGWGGIGDLGIAATNIAFPLSSVITALAALFGMGGAARFNLAMGEGKPDHARRSLGNGLFMMLVVGMVVGSAAILFLDPMLYLFGSTDAILPYARPYTLIISMGVPFAIFATGMSFFIRADGNPTFASVSLLAGAVLNMCLDPLFLFVFDMGIEGIALATTLGYVLSAGLALFYLLRRFRTVTLRRADLRPRLRLILNVCSLGIATCFTHIAMMSVQIVQSNTLRHYGALSSYGAEVPLAAAGAVSKVMIVFMACIIGIALGCQPLYGFNYGAKRYDRVRETYLTAIRYGTTIAVIAFLVIQLFPQQILSIFGSDDPMFYQFAERYMRIYLFMTFANAFQPTTSMFFSSIGKANLGFWMSLIRQIVLLIPLLIILPYFWGIDGMFFAGPIADAGAACIVLLFGWRELRKLNVLIREQADAPAPVPAPEAELS